MKDDDPEKRIRELERGLADTTHVAGGVPYTGGAAHAGGSPYDPGLMPPRRKGPFPWYVVVVLAIVVAVGIGYAATLGMSTLGRSRLGTGPRTAPSSSSGPTAVPQGGTLRVGGNSETKTIACNDGNLTLYGTSSKYYVTGHCASLKIGGYDNNVTVDSADTLESSGYSNTVTEHACNNGNLTLSAYGIAFYVAGHCASLTIPSYDNKVSIDSVDSINVSGYNNTVTYHSGAPKITDSGYSNTIHQG
jgi:Protein of unknown function (DUF3060)